MYMENIFEKRAIIISEQTTYTGDEQSEIFLDKVKSENPDMFVRFLNLVKNKGLEFAKDKYKEFDVELITKSQKDKTDDVNNKKIIDKFIRMIPKSFLSSIKSDDGCFSDRKFYWVLGRHLWEFEKRYGVSEVEYLEKLILDDGFERFKMGTDDSDIEGYTDYVNPYEEYFFTQLSKKMGETIEW